MRKQIMILLIVLVMRIIASHPRENNILVINELGTFEKNMTYNIETDKRGEIRIKAKGPQDRRWSPAYRFNRKSGADELHLDGTIIVNTQEKQCVLAYVEEIDGRSLKPVSGSFKIIEYRKLNGESINSGIIYTSTPRVEDKTSETNNRGNKNKEKTYYVESTVIIFILVLFFAIIIRIAMVS